MPRCSRHGAERLTAEVGPKTVMIEIEGIRKTFSHEGADVIALADVSLTIPKGQMCALMGPSGAGKSTLLHLVAGLATPDAGRVRVSSHDLSMMSDRDLTTFRRRHVGLVFQFFNLLPYLDAYENVALPLLLDSVNPVDERQRVERALESVGMAHRARHRPHQLSGGEMQRIAIARALAANPSVFLADEPTGNLDSDNGRQVMDLLRALNEERHQTMLVVTHDPVWASMCDRVVCLIDGLIVSDQELPRDDSGLDGLSA